MKKLLVLLLVVFCCGSLLAANQQMAEPQEKVADNVEKVIGKVVIVKEEGKPDVFKLLSGDKEYVLLPNDKLEELKKIEKFEEKMFEVELEAQLDKDGKVTAYMIKSFAEKKEEVQTQQQEQQEQSQPAQETNQEE